LKEDLAKVQLGKQWHELGRWLVGEAIKPKDQEWAEKMDNGGL
jgi:hypothetical protein